MKNFDVVERLHNFVVSFYFPYRSQSMSYQPLVYRFTAFPGSKRSWILWGCRCSLSLLSLSFPITSRLSPRMPPQRTLDIEQFRPSFSDSELAGLKQTLEHSRLPARTYAMDQAEYGITYDYMKEALDRWKNGFDWYVSSTQLKREWRLLTW